MNRLIIVAVVVAGLALAVFFALPRKTATVTTADERPSPLPEIESAEVTKLVVQHHVGEGDARQLQKVVLRRGAAEGDEEAPWALEEPVAAEANQSAVKTALTRLDELEITDVASEMADSHEDLEVNDESGVAVEVFAGDNQLASFVLGKYASGFTMMRLPEQDVVYRVRGSLKFAFGKKVADWRDKRVLELDSKQFSFVEFRNAQGSFAFSKDLADEDSLWAVERVDAVAPATGDGKAPAASGQRVSSIESYDQGKVRSVVATLARLRAVDFVDDEAVETGLAGDDVARVMFKIGTGDEAQEYTVVLGRELDGKVIAKRSDRDQVYLLSNYVGKRLRPDVAAFQKRVASPTKAAAGGGHKQVPPEVMKAAQDEMMRQKMLKQLAQQAAQ
jgi:hypothetical protein